MKKWLGFLLPIWLVSLSLFSAEVEVVQACLIPDRPYLTRSDRVEIARCLNWTSNAQDDVCYGNYQLSPITPIASPDEIEVDADEVSLSAHQRSVLRGNVEVRKTQHILQGDLAYIERDENKGEISRITLVKHVKYRMPDATILANKVVFYPNTKEAKVMDVLYLVRSQPHGARLWAYGRAQSVYRNSQEQILMEKATYTNCAPLENAWEIRAHKLILDKAKNKGIAKGAELRLHGTPILYTPYLSFPLSRKRQSGFLMPVVGSTTVGGFDIATPYYLNLAPNYDATFIPHLYTKRGVMVGGNFRYLSESSSGILRGNILPHDHNFAEFLTSHALEHSTERWEAAWRDSTNLFIPNLNFRIDARQLSDDYYLQDFSTNLASVTDRQILREAVLDYTDEHWLLNATAQSYQTLHPVNETAVSDAYERLPQLLAQGDYQNLPLGGHLQLEGAFDNFHWPSYTTPNPNSLRYHASPKFSLDERTSYGYFTPAIQWVGNAYDLSDNLLLPQQKPTLSLPRYSVDSGLFFERESNFFNRNWIQTLEPRLYYLNVPYRDQSQIPVFDSGYMIFTTEQIFRDNRYSGFDRIGDANQLSYGLTSRWLRENSGQEQVSMTIAQIRYFTTRKVPLCYNPFGPCEDSPLNFAYLSPTYIYSPVASHLVFHFSPLFSVIGDYVWDPSTRSTNNGQLNLHYAGEENHVVNFGYAYFVNGDLTQVGVSPLQDNALNQISFSYAWPFTGRLSTVGAYSYNVSKQYAMMALFGVQYDSCCWAARLIAGQTFRSLNPYALPEYTNSIFFQIFLKGLGSVGNSDPTRILTTYLPGYVDTFKS